MPNSYMVLQSGLTIQCNHKSLKPLNPAPVALRDDFNSRFLRNETQKQEVNPPYVGRCGQTNRFYVLLANYAAARSESRRSFEICESSQFCCCRNKP
jgi:hypothetical protein